MGVQLSVAALDQEDYFFSLEEQRQLTRFAMFCARRVGTFHIAIRHSLKEALASQGRRKQKEEKAHDDNGNPLI